MSGLDYRAARKIYAPDVVACVDCDAIIPPTSRLECIEQRCTYCLYARGLGRQADAAKRRILGTLIRRTRLIETMVTVPSDSSD